MFIEVNTLQKGAQREDLIIPLSVEVMEKSIRESGGLIKIVTYAPELDTDFKFTSKKGKVIYSKDYEN